MPFSLSSNRANIISTAVQTAKDIGEAKKLATELSWFDGIRDFFSSTVGDGSFSKQVQEKNQLISDIVEKSFELKMNIEEKLSALDLSRPLQHGMQDIVMSFKKTLPQNTVNQIKYCFGYNANDKNIVLRLKDGERQEEIKILDLSQSQSPINPLVLDAIPKYWVGTGDEMNAGEQMDSTRNCGVLSTNYDQFFKDAHRQGINGNPAMRERIQNASVERPSFVPKEVKTTEDQNKSLNSYSEALKEVNPEFNDMQKNIFFMLCSQNATVGKTFPLSRANVFMSKDDPAGVTVTVKTNKNNEMLVAISCDANLLSMYQFKNQGAYFMNEKPSARIESEVKFVVGQNGLVKCTSCEAPITHIDSEENLTAEQTFAIEYLKEIGVEMASCFKDNVLLQIHGTTNYRQTEAYVRQLEWEKSSVWEVPTSALEVNSRFVY